MKLTRVVIVQEYNTPYRNDFFNALNSIPGIELHLVYVGLRSRDRLWKDHLSSDFREHQIKVKVKHYSYTKNITDVNYFDLLRQVGRIWPDLIVTQMGKVSIVLALLRLVKQVRFIYWSEATLITENGKILNWKYKPFRKLFSAFIVPGKLASDYLKLSGYKLLKQNSFVMPNTVDDIFTISDSELNKKFLNLKVLRILYVGSYIHLKGLQVLSNAMQVINSRTYDRKVEFHFIGAGEVELLKANNVFDHHFLSKKDCLRFYKDSHVFVLPSLWDCNPLVAIEAAKCGNILLLSDGVGGYPELIDGNGEVFKRDDVSELVNVLDKTIKLPGEELRIMAARSMELTREYSHEASAHIMKGAITYLLGK